jgi:hypothetical protein
VQYRAEFKLMVVDVSTDPGVVPAAPGEPDVVYHYTDVGGLFGIIKDKVLWANDVWFMNDTREARYGIELIDGVLDDIALDSPAAADTRHRALALLDGIRQQEDLWRSYIACLSFVGDDLSQWRAYGSPRGFSIGFDTAKLRSLCPLTPELGRPTFRYVTYDETQQANNIAIQFNTATDQLSAAPVDDELDAAALSFIASALELVPAFKHAAFSSEQEVRLHVYRAADVSDGLLFRPGAMGLVPYVEVDLKDPGTNTTSAIREVIIGPQSNELESQRSVKQFLAYQGLSDVEVRLSRVPLRPR